MMLNPLNSWLSRRRSRAFWARFIKQAILRDFSPDSWLKRQLWKIPWVRARYVRRVKRQMEKAAQEIQNSMLDTMQRGYKLLEELAVYREGE
jgi:hypothetical protein